MQVVFSEKLYTGEMTPGKVKSIKRKITKGRPIFGLYVVTLPLESYGLLEIYSYNTLLQPHYQNEKNQIVIVGLMESQEDAIDMVTNLIGEMYTNTQGFDVKGYLEQIEG